MPQFVPARNKLWNEVRAKAKYLYIQAQKKVDSESAFFRENFKRLTKEKQLTHFKGLVNAMNVRNGALWLWIRQDVMYDLIVEDSRNNYDGSDAWTKNWKLFKDKNPEFDKLFDLRKMYNDPYPPQILMQGGGFDPIMIIEGIVALGALLTGSGGGNEPREIEMSELPQPPPEV